MSLEVEAVGREERESEPNKFQDLSVSELDAVGEKEEIDSIQ